MKNIKFFLPGIMFGIVMTKSEAISWFRIQEMFRFESFHMFGIIGTAVVIGVVTVALIKKFKGKSIDGEFIMFPDKEKSIVRYIFGGILFGMGWALSGTCPAPMYTLVGHGVWVILVVLASAVLGTYTYGLVKDKLPH